MDSYGLAFEMNVHFINKEQLCKCKEQYAVQIALVNFLLFAKDVVGTGRTMKALLSNIEKYKPNMVKVAR